MVNRLVTKEGHDGDLATRMWTAFCQYAALQLLQDRPPGLPPSKLVDEAWHAAILFTKDYHQWCMQHLGRFLHHEPNDGMSNSTQTPTRYADTRSIIERIFPAVDEEMWPNVKQAESSDCKPEDDCYCMTSRKPSPDCRPEDDCYCINWTKCSSEDDSD